jgi:hypothetical protein
MPWQSSRSRTTPHPIESHADGSQHPGEHPRQVDGDHRRAARRQTAWGRRLVSGIYAAAADLDLYDASRHAERLGDVFRFGFSGSVWRHFDRLETFPRGLLPFSDAICRFNPVYGQDMTEAAQEGYCSSGCSGARKATRWHGSRPPSSPKRAG